MPDTLTQPSTLGTGNSLRIAVISDLHVYDRTQLASGASSPSFLEIGAAEDLPTQHPGCFAFRTDKNLLPPR